MQRKGSSRIQATVSKLQQARKDGYGLLPALFKISRGKKIYQIIFHDVTEILQLRRKNQQWDLMERSALYTAITSAYPMIIFGNLTRNTCSVFRSGGTEPAFAGLRQL